MNIFLKVITGRVYLPMNIGLKAEQPKISCLLFIFFKFCFLPQKLTFDIVHIWQRMLILKNIYKLSELNAHF